MFKIIKEIRELISEFGKFVSLYKDRETTMDFQITHLQQSINHMIDSDNLSQFLQEVTGKNIYLKTEIGQVDGIIKKSGIIATYEVAEDTGLMQKQIKGFVVSDEEPLFVYPDAIKEYILKN